MRTFQQLLDPRVLTASYASIQSIIDYELTNMFYVNTSDYLTDDFELIHYPAVNTPAPMNIKGG